MTIHPYRNWRRRLAVEAEALGPDLVSAYVALMGGPTTAGEHLSALTGRHYSANLLCRWRRGSASVPEPAQDAMRVVLLAELVGDAAPAVARVLSAPQNSTAAQARL